MRRLLMVLVCLCVAGSAMAAVSTTNLGKAPGIQYVNPGGERQGADVIPGLNIGQVLPYTDNGTTVGYNNDYDEVCPYSGSTSPDVVYEYIADGAYTSINVDLCYSSFDTKVYVYDSLDLINPLACCDDYYFAAPCYTYSSFVGPVGVIAGHTYYIVVDGYGGSSGVYQIDVTDGGIVPPSGACCAPAGTCTVTTEVACPAPSVWQGENTNCNPNPCPQPPPVACPTGSLIENEPLCQDNYTDNYNGGCNSTPVVWQTLGPQADNCAVMCGKACTYLNFGSSTRDTDWYLSVSGGNITYQMTADFPFMMALFTGTDCAGLVYTYYIGAPNDIGNLAAAVAVGNDVGFFAANSGFSGYPVEGTYVMNVCGITPPPPPPGACCSPTGACIVTTPELCAFMGGTFQGDPTCGPNTCIPTPTETKSWGAVKNLYR